MGLPADFDFACIRSTDDAASMISSLPNRDRGNAALGLSRCSSLKKTTVYRGLMTTWEHDHFAVLKAFGSGKKFADALRQVAPRLNSRRRKLLVYRGVTCPDAAYGIAWTSDRDIACWFAMREYPQNDATPWVFRAEMNTEYIITKHDERSEKEILIHPDVFLDESVDVFVDGGSRRYPHDVDLMKSRRKLRSTIGQLVTIDIKPQKKAMEAAMLAPSAQEVT